MNVYETLAENLSAKNNLPQIQHRMYMIVVQVVWGKKCRARCHI